MVRQLNIDGDGQADLAGQSGEQCAVFVGVTPIVGALPWTE